MTEEWDVYLSSELASHLHLLHLPSEYHLQKLVKGNDAVQKTGTLAAKMKPRAGIFQVDLPLDPSSEYFDREKSEIFARNALGEAASSSGQAKRPLLDHQRLCGTSESQESAPVMTVGTINDGIQAPPPFIFVGKIFLTPIASSISMQVVHSHLDAADAALRAASRKPTAGQTLEESMRPVQVYTLDTINHILFLVGPDKETRNRRASVG